MARWSLKTFIQRFFRGSPRLVVESDNAAIEPEEFAEEPSEAISGLGDRRRLGAEEWIFRPLYRGNHYAPTKGVKSLAFEPPSSPPRVLSVAHADGLSVEEKLHLAGEIMALINREKEQPERMRAWAELRCDALDALTEQLKELEFFAERDNEDYDRHTTIWGYPDNEEDLRNTLIYGFLAARASSQRVDERKQQPIGELKAPIPG